MGGVGAANTPTECVYTDAVRMSLIGALAAVNKVPVFVTLYTYSIPDHVQRTRMMPFLVMVSSYITSLGNSWSRGSLSFIAHKIREGCQYY